MASTDGTIKIGTELDQSGLKKGLSGIDGLVKKGLGGVATVAKTAVGAVVGVSTALAGAGAASIKVGASFEAGMSKVAAISGAAGEELAALTDKAKEMGAKTKFSASEAADAMSYMAMAGWKTEDMLNGIEGIMNLAAASGEDLASTSDIVTDALTAMGLAASDSGHFADVLAAASSNSNTNVAMMGETFKYAAPLAGALGYNIEDLAQAIGLMANSGIKGSQAGTALRSILTRLAKPTSETEAAMSKYNISLKNSDGSMKTLMEVMENLRDSLQGLSEDEQASAAAAIGGQEAMSGLLAIVNASETDFDKLADAIMNADGSAEQMADTMIDNLAGATTILKSSLEGLGIEIYESMQEPLKDTVKQCTVYVNEMTDAFKNDGAAGAAEAAGGIIASLIAGMAQGVPGIVETAVTAIKAFEKGIIENKGALLDAAKDVADAFADGLIDLLPRSVRTPVRKAVDEIKKSFADGGLKKGVETVSTIFKNFGKILSQLTKTILPPFVKILDFTGDHLDILLPVVAAVCTAFKGFSIVKSATDGIGKLAGAAKGLFAILSANPIGAVVSVVAGLTAGLVVLAATTEDATEAQYGLTDAQKELIDRNAELAESYRETDEAKQEAFAGINSEYGYYEELWNELQGIVDQNGKVKEGYEERAAFITSTLSEALGIEIDLVDGQIQNYEELDQTVQKVMATKKAEAMLDADQNAYTEAIKNQDEALQNYLSTQKEYNEKKKEHEELVKAAEDAERHFNEVAEEGGAVAQEAEQAWSDAVHARDVSKESLDKLEESYTEASDTYLGYVNTIRNHEGVASAVISGDADQIEDALTLMEHNFVHAEGATRESLQNQVTNLKQTYADMQQAVKDGAPGVTQEAVDEMGLMVEKADAELQKFDDLALQRAKESGESYASGIRDSVPLTESEAAGMVDAEYRTMQSRDFTAIGQNQINQIKSGIQSKSPEAATAAENVMIGAKAAAAAIDSTSVGVNFGAGIVAGIASKVGDAAAAGANIMIAAMNSSNKAQDSHSPSKKMIKSGRNFGAGAKIGIEDMTPRVAKAGANMATSAMDSFRERMKDFDFSGTVGRIRGIMSGRNLSYSSAVQTQVGYTGRRSEWDAADQFEERTITQNINIYQPVKSPVETARELKKVGRELAFGK